MDSFESDADLCVLGGGIAGMLVAERALSLGRRVLLRGARHAADRPATPAATLARRPAALQPQPASPAARRPAGRPAHSMGQGLPVLAGLQPGRLHEPLLRQHATVPPVAFRRAGLCRRHRPEMAARLTAISSRTTSRPSVGSRSPAAPPARRSRGDSTIRCRRIASARPIARVRRCLAKTRSSKCQTCGPRARSAAGRRAAAATSATSARSIPRARLSTPSIRRSAIA